MAVGAPIRLSLCMATYKRAAWIAETLDSIEPQLGEDVELVIVDGASPDGTEAAVAPYAARCPHIRYVRESENSGVDADYDKCVGYARGQYAWLVADDDLIAPGAVARVLDALADDPDLLVVDAEVRDVTLTHLLEPGRLPFRNETRSYGPADGDALLAETGNALSFIGCAVVRREWWLSRDRAAYYGSLFVHVGAIFQSPPPRLARALAEPLVTIRLGNAMWSSRSFEIWMFKWPDLVWSFAGYSDAAKAAVVPREPWRLPLRVFLYRANGAFDLDAYRRFFAGRKVGAWRALLVAAALFPAKLANFLAAALLVARRKGRGSGAYDLVACSSVTPPATRALVRRLAAPAWLGDRR